MQFNQSDLETIRKYCRLTGFEADIKLRVDSTERKTTFLAHSVASFVQHRKLRIYGQQSLVLIMEDTADVEQPPTSEGNDGVEEACSEGGFLVVSRSSTSEVSTVFEDMDVPAMDHSEAEHHWCHGTCDHGQEVEVATAKLLSILTRFLVEDLPRGDKSLVLERVIDELENGLSTRQQSAFPKNRGSAAESTSISILDRPSRSVSWCPENEDIVQGTSQKTDVATQDVNVEVSERDSPVGSLLPVQEQRSSPSKQDITRSSGSGEQYHIEQRLPNSVLRNELVSNWLRRLPA
ncbi:hypothetical protein SLS56_009842 [Neofusicoccum ribis]|uniref:Uncharacterized protein n=1 Tax=Neofusicoccum ribis TaxID=45134 RepID=A0ABR3SG40_9PEZI